MASLAQYVRNKVDPEQYYKKLFPDISWASGSNETRVLSPFVDETVPSLSLNKDTGAWYSFCASDEHGGNSIISFQAAYYDCSNREAARTIFHQFIHPIIPVQKVHKWIKKLWGTPTVLRYLQSRLIGKRTIKQYELGWNGTRIVIPIKNEFGLCINAKLCDPAAKDKIPKMLSYTDDKEERSYGSPTTLYPMATLMELNDPIFICEGEWDTLSLLSIGISAVTSTTGAKTWPGRHNELFRNRRVVLVYDNDEPGREGSKRVFKQLINVAKNIKQIDIPRRYGKDVNNYMLSNKKMRDPKSWQALVKKARILVENPDELIAEKEVVQTSLDQASLAKWYGQRIEVEALITGKDVAPYLLPHKFRVSCTGECEGCPIAKDGKGFRDCEVDMLDPDVLTMVDTSKNIIRGKLLNIAGIRTSKDCSAKIDIIKTFNVEYLLLIPALGSGSKEYVMRPAYYIGHGLHSNKAYCFKGVLTSHPRDQHTICLFDSARPVQDEVDTFELKESVKKKLVRFRPKKLKYLAHLMSIAEWQSRNITKILERPDLHIAIDLAYHSLRAFWFNKEFIFRGMLDVLILGDTRCGKGYVTEGLSRYYKLGEIASGDNCSFAGLVGGLQQLGRNWRITWGLIPLNNGRLVIIDETSSLSERDIGRMSRIRSEGVAEIVKIIREVTQANTRLIWLANPRSGRPISTYNTGVEAVKELVGAIEDISRYDFVLTLASDEVPSEIINTPATYSTSDVDKYPPELCQALVLWAWSRTPEQIKFTDEATNLIIDTAIEFGHTYSPIIPLVQTENVRIKIAKVSAAVAAQTFSTDPTCENLIIDVEHVKCARQILRMFYNKPSMAYDLFSRTTLAAARIERLEEVDEVLENLSQNKQAVIIGLLETHQISTDNLSDYVGDFATARTMIGELVQLRCLSRIEGSNWYLKNPDFTKWLRKAKTKSKRKKR